MHPFSWKRVSLWLLAILLVSFAFRLALPRILGLAAERWLAVPGVESLLIDIDEIDAGQVRLREVGVIFRSAAGHRLQASMHGITLAYSLTERRIQRLDVDSADIEIASAAATEESPWPHITWPRPLINDVRIKDLRLAVRKPDALILKARGHLHLHQDMKQLSAEFRTDGGLVRLTAAPAEGSQEMLEFHSEWRPKNGLPSNVALRIDREPAQQPATLSGKVALPVLTSLGKDLGLELPVEFSDGILAFQADVVLGSTAGTLRKFSGETELSDVHGQLTQTSVPVELSSAGKLRFSWQSSSVRLELQPGWKWQIDAGGKQSLSATGRLNSVFAIDHSGGAIRSDGSFPIVLHTKSWGNWEGAVEHLQLTQNSATEEKYWSAMDARLRLKGGVKAWQQGVVQVNNARATGNVALHWLHPGKIRAEIAMQATVDRVDQKGATPISAGPTTWKVDADATARTNDDFWKTMELNGNASTPQLKISFEAGDTLMLAPTRLQWSRLRPAVRSGVPAAENAEGEFQLSSDAVRLKSWPASAMRTRLRLNNGSLHGEGALLLQDAELLRFSGSHALSGGCGEATFATRQSLPTFDKQLQPRPPHLLPLVLGAGDVDGRVGLNWCFQPATKIEAKGALQLRGAALGWDQARFQDVHGTLQLDGLNPLRGRIDVRSQSGQLATGTSLTDTKVDLALGERSLTVHALHAGLLGGTLHGGPLTLNWPPTGQPLPLEIRGIDLGQLLALPDINGLSGSGKLNGVLPLVYRAASLEIPEGRLTSSGAGTINYAPSAALPDNPGLQALRNFHFRNLDVRLHYGGNGNYRLHNILEGNNPDFYNGYPIRFKLDINGALPGLFRAALFSGDFNRHILEQLRSGTLE